MPGRRPDSARRRSSGYSTSAAGPLCEARDRDVAGVVVEGGDEAAERHERVRDQAAPHAGVHGVGERADLDVGPDQAAEAGGQRRYADVPVAGVGDDDDVGLEPLLVVLEQAGRVSEPTSSSPSMNIVTLTGRSSPKTRSAPRWAAIPALSSAAPRP